MSLGNIPTALAYTTPLFSNIILRHGWYFKLSRLRVDPGKNNLLSKISADILPFPVSAWIWRECVRRCSSYTQTTVAVLWYLGIYEST